MKKLLPILLVLIGVGAGVGAGVMLKSDPADMVAENPCGDINDHKVEPEHAQVNDPEHEPEYVQLNNQFVVPVVNDDMVESLVVMSLGIEVNAGNEEVVYQREPKLRDALLQVLFDHANIGGFRGRFTDGNNMDVLRVSLTETAQSVIGSAVISVIITDIARQDV